MWASARGYPARAISRSRPRLPVGPRSIVAPPDRFSFPSGHATATLALALPIAVSGSPVWGGVLILAALVVGISRCYLGVHYPGDVLAGWILAGVSAAVTRLVVGG